jgi:phosphonate transport system substrate-binding protein
MQFILGLVQNLCGTLWRKLILMSVALVIASPLSIAYADVILTFGTYAADKPTATVRKFKPFLDYLSQEMTKELGELVHIKIKISSKYNDGITKLVDGKVDFSRFGPASYVMAKDRNPNIKIIAMESKKGKKTFKGIIAIHTDSKFEQLGDLKGHSFAFGDPLSTIGRYLAQAQLFKAGITGNDLSNFAYLGRHDRVGAAVANQSFDAGALKESTFKKIQAKNSAIKALYTFDNVTKPWIASSNISPLVLNALSKVILEVDDPAVLKNISKSGFLAGDDQDYDTIRAAIARSSQFN